jgi:selenium metabolism protein YedF
MRTVDARGKLCPQPVILTRNALSEASELLVIVDEATAQENVSRMAEKAGHHVEVEHREDGTYLHIVRTTAQPGHVTREPGQNGVILVAGDTLGRGEAELGSILMRGFMHTLTDVQPLPNTIIFINSGVRLVAGGSEVLEDLQSLCESGVEVLACGTCLKYYGLIDQVAVGQVSNMYAIAETLLRAGSVIST